MIRLRPLLALLPLLAAALVPAAAGVLRAEDPAATPRSGLRSEHDVMESAFCAGCHPAIYAEHEQSTHGRAFTDAEVRLATARFAHGDCIICHTPRPVFETGVGQNPRRRHYGLTDGNSCMTCHWQPEYDYSRFEGGAQCVEAFHPDVGTVEACASCHRNHGTPYQWEKSPIGKESGRTCMDCHMELVERPVAVGGPVRFVRQHVFPGSRSEEQVKRAYRYTAEIEGSEVRVTIQNRGAGHNFPTELKQRSVESLVTVFDTEGNEIARSRMVFRDPYKRPYGLKLPVNTQIPSGESRTHTVPLGVEAGHVETRLFFKLYFPIDDYHSDLSRVLESRVLPFSGIEPSSEPVETAPDVVPVLPEDIAPEVASVANFVDFGHPKIGRVEIVVPEGDGPEDIEALIALFQFPAPEGNKRGQDRLVEIGLPAVPALIDALGSWDNKTYNQALGVLQRIGNPAREQIVAAFEDERLYVRLHARELAARMGWRGDDVTSRLEAALAMPDALDRASAADVIGRKRIASLGNQLLPLLEDDDPDVVRAGAIALGLLERRDAIDSITAALERAPYVETQYDLALALAHLGSPAGIPKLLTGLEHPDDLIRERAFETFFEATGLHFGFDPLAPRPERLDSLAMLTSYWSANGGPEHLIAPDPEADPVAEAHAWHLVTKLGGSDYLAATPEDAAYEEELVGMGKYAVPALVQGLKYPPGFSSKRASICRALGRIGDRRAAPALAATLRDPVLSVAAWAAWALEATGDDQNEPALRRYEQRLRTAIATRRVPESFGLPERALAQVARTRYLLGEESTRHTLAGLLLSDDLYTRQLAFGALQFKTGEDRGYDPEADAPTRREAALRWLD